MNINNRGFTLIELLVVIAIIGILSSVVLGSINIARSKGTDSAIKQAMEQIRVQAALYYDTRQNYGTAVSSTACNLSTSVFASTSALTSNADIFSPSIPWCSTNGVSWSVTSALKSDPAKVWCVDDSGNSRLLTVATSTFQGSSLSNSNFCS